MAFAADPAGTSMGCLDKWMHSRRGSLLVKRTRNMYVHYDQSPKISHMLTDYMASQVVHQ
jgi:hypothetical protein